jgi:hypothetical protein
MTNNNEPSGYPDNNPKTVLGVQKTPLNLVPPSAKYHLAAAFADGAVKYGPYNWRDNNVSASIYVAAALRHIDEWWDGEDLSRDAKVHHIAHAMACLAILLDAESIGMLNDDRPTKGASTDLHEEYAENNKKERDAEKSNPSNEFGPDHEQFGEPMCYSPNFDIIYPVVHGRIPDLPSNVLPENLAGWWYRGTDGEWDYWESPDGRVAGYNPAGDRRMSQPTVSELFSGGGATFNELYDLTQRDSGGALPMATGDGDSGSSGTDESPELRVHNDR